MFKVNRFLNVVCLVLVGFMVSQDGVASCRHAWQESLKPVLTTQSCLQRLSSIKTYAVTNNPAYERVTHVRASSLFGIPEERLDENMQPLPLRAMDYQVSGRILVLAYSDPFRQEFSDRLISGLNISLWRFLHANQWPQVVLMSPKIIILTEQTYQALNSFIDLGIYKGSCLPVLTFVTDRGGEIRKALKFTNQICAGTLPLLLMGGGYGKVISFNPFDSHEPGRLTDDYARFEMALESKQKHD